MDNNGSYGQDAALEIDPFKIPNDLCTAIPYDLIRSYQVIPMYWDQSTLVMASSRLLNNTEISTLESSIDRPIRNIRATHASVFFAMHVIARRTKQHAKFEKSTRPLPPQKTGQAQHTGSHTPFGQHLIADGVMNNEVLNAHLATAIATHLPLGEYLVQKGIITRDLRDKILGKIEGNYTHIFNKYMREMSHSRGKKG